MNSIVMNSMSAIKKVFASKKAFLESFLADSMEFMSAVAGRHGIHDYRVSVPGEAQACSLIFISTVRLGGVRVNCCNQVPQKVHSKSLESHFLDLPRKSMQPGKVTHFGSCNIATSTASSCKH